MRANWAQVSGGNPDVKKPETPGERVVLVVQTLAFLDKARVNGNNIAPDAPEPTASLARLVIARCEAQPSLSPKAALEQVMEEMLDEPDPSTLKFPSGRHVSTIPVVRRR